MLVLMVFIGQATAATSASCQMNTNDQNIHQSMDTTNHNAKDMVNHIIITDTETQSSMDDCCAQDCNCTLDGCSSVMLLSSPHHVWEVIALQTKSDRSFLVARQSPTSLYRPPISL